MIPGGPAVRSIPRPPPNRRPDRPLVTAPAMAYVPAFPSPMAGTFGLSELNDVVFAAPIMRQPPSIAPLIIEKKRPVPETSKPAETKTIS